MLAGRPAFSADRLCGCGPTTPSLPVSCECSTHSGPATRRAERGFPGWWSSRAMAICKPACHSLACSPPGHRPLECRREAALSPQGHDSRTSCVTTSGRADALIRGGRGPARLLTRNETGNDGAESGEPRPRPPCPPMASLRERPVDQGRLLLQVLRHPVCSAAALARLLRLRGRNRWSSWCRGSA